MISSDFNTDFQSCFLSDHNERPAGGKECGRNSASGAGFPVHRQTWRGMSIIVTKKISPKDKETDGKILKMGF